MGVDYDAAYLAVLLAPRAQLPFYVVQRAVWMGVRIAVARELFSLKASRDALLPIIAQVGEDFVVMSTDEFGGYSEHRCPKLTDGLVAQLAIQKRRPDGAAERSALPTPSCYRPSHVSRMGALYHRN